MDIPAADINQIIEAFAQCASDFRTYWNDQSQPELESDNDPEVLIVGMVDLLELLYIHQTSGQNLSTDELTELSSYALNMLQALSQDAESIGYGNHLDFEDISFPLCLWLARHDAELEELDPLVNTLARLANAVNQPDQLETLFSQSTELLDALSVTLTQDLEQAMPDSALSVFLINRGIIATRSLNTDCMESAYDTIVEYLPEISHEFFAEGMEQMELLDYPEYVRNIVARYYNNTRSRTLLH
jgi:hypothetical protein